MDEAMDSAGSGGCEHRQSACDIAFLERCLTAPGDNARNVNDPVSILDQAMKCGPVVEIPRNPVHSISCRLLAAGEGGDGVARIDRDVDEM